MVAELRWILSVSTSSLHAARQWALGKPLVDPVLAEVIAQPAADFQRMIHAAGLPEAAFWRHLLGLSSGIENDRQLAELAVRKTVGESQVALLSPHLAGLIRDIELAVLRGVPDLLDQLALRSGPFCEQWEARGPGLLAEIGKLTDPQLIVDQADVILVQPAVGGAGEAHLPYNKVHLEAVLANPFPNLPEVARLGWLLAQLNLDLPVYSEAIDGQRLPDVGRLAMLPAVLKAAETVELVRFDVNTVRMALELWDIQTPPDIDAADTLLAWWETHLESPGPWHVALTALDRMFDTV